MERRRPNPGLGRHLESGLSAGVAGCRNWRGLMSLRACPIYGIQMLSLCSFPKAKRKYFLQIQSLNPFQLIAHLMDGDTISSSLVFTTTLCPRRNEPEPIRAKAAHWRPSTPAGAALPEHPALKTTSARRSGGAHCSCSGGAWGRPGEGHRTCF